MTYGDYKDQQEEQIQIKYYARQHLKLVVIHSMMDIKEDLPQWFTIFLIKNVQKME